jgi:hypothetical protein
MAVSRTKVNISIKDIFESRKISNFEGTHTLTERWLAGIFFLHHKRGESEVLTISLTFATSTRVFFPAIISRFAQGKVDDLRLAG